MVFFINVYDCVDIDKTHIYLCRDCYKQSRSTGLTIVDGAPGKDCDECKVGARIETTHLAGKMLIEHMYCYNRPGWEIVEVALKLLPGAIFDEPEILQDISFDSGSHHPKYLVNVEYAVRSFVYNGKGCNFYECPDGIYIPIFGPYYEDMKSFILEFENSHENSLRTIQDIACFPVHFLIDAKARQCGASTRRVINRIKLDLRRCYENLLLEGVGDSELFCKVKKVNDEHNN